MRYRRAGKATWGRRSESRSRTKSAASASASFLTSMSRQVFWSWCCTKSRAARGSLSRAEIIGTTGSVSHARSPWPPKPPVKVEFGNEPPLVTLPSDSRRQLCPDCGCCDVEPDYGCVGRCSDPDALANGNCINGAVSRRRQRVAAAAAAPPPPIRLIEEFRAVLMELGCDISGVSDLRALVTEASAWRRRRASTLGAFSREMPLYHALRTVLEATGANPPKLEGHVYASDADVLVEFAARWSSEMLRMRARFESELERDNRRTDEILDGRGEEST